MKRIPVAVAVLMVAFAGFALADDMPGSPTHHDGGLGFHNSAAPVGIRWWFSGQKIGLDLGLGYSHSPAGSDPDESVTGFAIDLGVPFIAHSWDRAHLILRPGILYQSQEIGSGAGPAFTTITPTILSILGEIEAEVFLVDNVSVSASHGIAYSSFDPDVPGVDSQSTFGTFGNNFTNVGFHVYFLGGGH